MWKVILSGLALVALHQVAGAAEWWDNSIIYQVYPRSFKDSDGDGVGDINGVTSKLDHIKDTGAKALWLSPIFESPQIDFGYDISNFTRIDPQFGTVEDFRKLIAKAKTLGLKVLLDLVPNHSSDQHEWFKKSVDGIKPYDNYYLWKDARKLPNGTRLPPNNWLSVFGGSGWTWNEKRQQYFFHQFASSMPDFDYRDPQLNIEMDNVIRYWLDQGVDGFRVDAIVHLFEDEKFLDEPRANVTGVPPDDYDYLNHVYTRDQNETYYVVRRWRKLMDEHSAAHKTDKKFGIVESGSPLYYQMKYYEYGMDPFNFMFTETNNRTRPSEFVRLVKNLLENLPKRQGTNWVVGNHDINRTASRYGVQRADQMSMLGAVMPGMLVIYNGDEIGMLDRPMTWEETVDPQGCGAGPERYPLKSRDPARTPFQWDDTTSAGFSTSNRTWLPVHENYKTLNLKKQKADKVSHFKVFQALAKLKRNSEVVRSGQVEISHDKDRVLGVVRRLPHKAPVALLINFDEKPVTLDLATWLHLPDTVTIYTASVSSRLRVGAKVRSSRFDLPASATVILTGRSLSS